MNLRTIGLISTLVLGLLAASVPAEPQPAGKVYRIGYLRYPCGSPNASYIEFRKGLLELGYVEGQNFVIEHRCADRKRELRSKQAAEVVRLKVDVIVTPPSASMVRLWQRTTRTIPIVMNGIRVDPVEAGFVDSLARPGGNITGLTNFDVKLHPKRLELLKEAFPRISRVAILWSPNQQKQARKEVEAVGEALSIQIHRVVAIAGSLDDLERVFSAISREVPDALIVASFPLTLRHRARVIELTAKRRLSTLYDSVLFVDAGGLMSYGPRSADNYRRAAIYVDKILKGAKPADLPVEQPTRFRLVINLKTAKTLGITIPPQFLARADKVIK